MTEINRYKTKTSDKKSLFDFFIEIMGWLQIVASPFLIGLIIGGIIYFRKPNTTTLIIGIAMATIGLCIGIVWATRVWRKKGTINFMSRIMATSDLNNKVEDQK